MKRCLIVTGGYISHSFLTKTYEESFYDIIIGVDKGNDALKSIGVIPNIVVGDMDSIDVDTTLWLKTFEAVIWHQFDSEKDDSDTGLALSLAADMSCTHVDLLGATGSRVDHMITNILMAEQYMNRFLLRIIDSYNEITMYKAPLLDYNLGKKDFTFFSLIPISGQVRGVTYKGAKYPLNQATLFRGSSLPISNEWIKDEVSVIVEEGLFLLIKSKDKLF